MAIDGCNWYVWCHECPNFVLPCCFHHNKNLFCRFDPTRLCRTGWAFFRDKNSAFGSLGTINPIIKALRVTQTLNAEYSGAPVDQSFQTKYRSATIDAASVTPFHPKGSTPWAAMLEGPLLMKRLHQERCFLSFRFVRSEETGSTARHTLMGAKRQGSKSLPN